MYMFVTCHNKGADQATKRYDAEEQGQTERSSGGSDGRA